MDDKYGRSPLWEHHNSTAITRKAVTDLSGFKSNAVNFKLALWDPASNGVRYLKTLAHELAMRMSEEEWRRLRRVRNRDVGAPISARVHGQDVCVDYLQAVFELGFISRNVTLDNARVLEVGAGYGRTCHSMMSNHDIAEYCIVDLDNALLLSRAYLERVLDEESFSRIRFVRAEEVEAALEGRRYDLCVNIDSFAEMNPETVEHYLNLVDAHCAHLYVNNPVGKYLPDGHSDDDEVVRYALSTGPLRQVLDIYDSEAVSAAAVRFVSAYRPGEHWKCAAEARSVPWSYYWQALYGNENPVP
ncbi:putative sugar O-methyltransferase [Nocardiopsis xinjiangensis]|uniref:putative sugar O-methyltransferase n=1 Tax=Nocardiopsis xinjiangensis TaxID=124285 RepID=UPI00034B6C95|nr:putative sugar O-methyltransferase [Nocardiopsis xinjiangensis]